MSKIDERQQQPAAGDPAVRVAGHLIVALGTSANQLLATARRWDPRISPRAVAVHFRHLDIGDDQIGFARATQFHEFPAIPGCPDHGMAQARQDLLEILPHIGFIVGDGNT